MHRMRCSYAGKRARRPIPQSLMPTAERIFGLRMPDQKAVHSTVFRCAEGHVLVCSYGTNLPCGKANSDRDLSRAGIWCRDHLYDWGSADGTPKVIAEIEDSYPH